MSLLRWNRAIGQNIVTMKRLPLKLCLEKNTWQYITQLTKDLSRKYLTIRIEELLVWEDFAWFVLDNIGKEIRCLEIKMCYFEVSTENKAKLLKEIFENMPKLERIVFDSCEVLAGCINTIELQKANFSYLKSVVLNKTNWEVCR